MKSMLELLKEQKSMTELAIAKMNEAQKEYRNQLYSVYPTDGTSDERIAFADETERLSALKDSAFKAAGRRLVSFGEFLGLKVEKKDIEEDYRIESRFHDFVYYCERLEKTFEYNVESFNQYHC